ncbi:MAG: SH3 domain-containing protein [Anaerolineae bacterium]|nr:SH3 domain-containing protein [Anaerolineae bacterium]
MIRRLAIVTLILVFTAGGILAQDATPTPAVINLSAAAPVAPAVESAIATPTRTPAPPSGALLEAKEIANVRAEPSTEATQLGTIRAWETYRIIGRYVRWLQFEFPQAPNGRGWVYDELVNITGDASTIPDIDLAAQATPDPLLDGLTQTAAAITLTPGGGLTATVVARVGVISTNETPTREILPTFTFPPEMVAIAPTAGVAETATPQPISVPLADGTALPPLVPILVLGGLGLVGLALSSLRRG